MLSLVLAFSFTDTQKIYVRSYFSASDEAPRGEELLTEHCKYTFGRRGLCINIENFEKLLLHLHISTKQCGTAYLTGNFLAGMRASRGSL